MMRVIGLGEYLVSSDPEDSIKTFALASCVGLVAYNKKERILGMVHIVLPEVGDGDSTITKGVGYYADTAVPLLLEKVSIIGQMERKDYKIALYGGATSRNEKDIFCIGERNVAQIEQVLMARHFSYDRQNTGGRYSRTIEAFVRTGEVVVKTQQMKW